MTIRLWTAIDVLCIYSDEPNDVMLEFGDPADDVQQVIVPSRTEVRIPIPPPPTPFYHQPKAAQQKAIAKTVADIEDRIAKNLRTALRRSPA